YLEHRLGAVRQLAYERRLGALGDAESFRRRSGSIQQEYGGFQALNWVSPEGVITWVVPEERNRGAVGRDLRETPAAWEAHQRAAASPGTLVATPPLELFQGGRGFAVYLNLGAGQGSLNAVFRIAPLVEGSLMRGVL